MHFVAHTLHLRNLCCCQQKYDPVSTLPGTTDISPFHPHDLSHAVTDRGLQGDILYDRVLSSLAERVTQAAADRGQCLKSLFSLLKNSLKCIMTALQQSEGGFKPSFTACTIKKNLE